MDGRQPSSLRNNQRLSGTHVLISTSDLVVVAILPKSCVVISVDPLMAREELVNRLIPAARRKDIWGQHVVGQGRGENERKDVEPMHGEGHAVLLLTVHGHHDEELPSCPFQTSDVLLVLNHELEQVDERVDIGDQVLSFHVRMFDEGRCGGSRGSPIALAALYFVADSVPEGQQTFLLCLEQFESAGESADVHHGKSVLRDWERSWRLEW